jgi:hypothetical protein
MICNGCAAHTLNLLLHDMFDIDVLDAVQSAAVTITKFVRHRPALLYHFRDKQRAMLGSSWHRFALKIPVSTRWYSTVACISSVIRNQSALLEVFDNTALLARYANAQAKLNRVKAALASRLLDESKGGDQAG